MAQVLLIFALFFKNKIIRQNHMLQTKFQVLHAKPTWHIGTGICRRQKRDSNCSCLLYFTSNSSWRLWNQVITYFQYFFIQFLWCWEIKFSYNVLRRKSMAIEEILDLFAVVELQETRMAKLVYYFEDWLKRETFIK